MSFNGKEIAIFSFSNTRDSQWQQHGVNNSVRLPNHYTQAKLENELRSVKYIKRYSSYLVYINMIYYT